MTDILLYAFPGSCSNVSMILLEQIPIDYEIKLVKLINGEHKSRDYLDINPKGKVPALSVDGEIFTENPAIITLLNALFPEAKLLPSAETHKTQAQQLSDLCFISSTVHPLVTRLCKPEFFGPVTVSNDITRRATEGLKEAFSLIEQRLNDKGPWWYGDIWSAMDAYLFWVFNRVSPCGFNSAPYPNFSSHDKRMRDLRAVTSATKKINLLKAQLG